MTSADMAATGADRAPSVGSGGAASAVAAFVRRRLGWLILTVALAVLVLQPLIRLQMKALSNGGSGYDAMLELSGFWTTLRTTIALGVGSTAIALVLGTALAYWVARCHPRLRGPISIVPLIPLVVPAVAAVSGWAFLLSPRVGYLNILLRKTPLFDHLRDGPFNVYSVPWIILVTAFSLTSFVYVFAYAGVRNLGDEFEAAAAACGASGARRFLTITLPLLRPSLVYAAGICVLLGVGQFTAPLLLGRQENINVLTTEIFRLLLRFPVDYGLGAALSSPLIVIGAVIIIIQRRALRHQDRFVVHTGKATSSTRKTSAWPAIPVLLYGLVTVVLPLLALVHVAVSPYWTGKLSFDGLTLDHFRATLFDNPNTRRAIWTSVKASGLAVLIVIPLTFFLALSMLRQTRVWNWIRAANDILVVVPLGVPAAIFGFAILFTYSQAPFQLYGSLAVIVIAYVTLMIPQATRLQSATLMSLSPDYWDASKACGGRGWRTIVTIVFPLVRPGVMGAAALMVVMLFHEFTASMMVRAPRTQVMATVLYDLWTAGTYPEVAVMSLVMVVVTTVGVGLAVAAAGRRALEVL